MMGTRQTGERMEGRPGMAEERNIQDILAEVADQAEQTRDEVTKMYRSKRLAVEPSQVYSIRIPVSRLGRIRALAAKYGMAPTAMLRKWILERLDEEEQSEGNPSIGRPSGGIVGRVSAGEANIVAIAIDAHVYSAGLFQSKLRESIDQAHRRMADA